MKWRSASRFLSEKLGAAVGLCFKVKQVEEVSEEVDVMAKHVGHAAPCFAGFSPKSSFLNQRGGGNSRGRDQQGPQQVRR